MGEDDGHAALPARRRAALAGLGFLVVTAVAAPVTLASGGGTPAPVTTPTASPLPTGIDVAVSGTETAESADTVTVTLQNKGAAVRVVAARVEGLGYESSEVYGLTGLGAADVGQATVSLRPTCSAGIGVARRPELVLDVRAHDGTARTVRLDLTDSVPPVLAGTCTAPLGTGARLGVAVLPPAEDGGMRLRLLLTAGRGPLWAEGIESRSATFDGIGTLPVILAPGASQELEVEVRVGLCSDLSRTGDPLGLRLLLRREPTDTSGEGSGLSFAQVGGEPYLRAVRAAVARACP